MWGVVERDLNIVPYNTTEAQKDVIVKAMANTDSDTLVRAILNPIPEPPGGGRNRTVHIKTIYVLSFNLIYMFDCLEQCDVLLVSVVNPDLSKKICIIQ